MEEQGTSKITSEESDVDEVVDLLEDDVGLGLSLVSDSAVQSGMNFTSSQTSRTHLQLPPQRSLTDCIEIECDTNTKVTLSPSKCKSVEKLYTYSVKVMRHVKKSLYTIEKLPQSGKFCSLKDLQKELQASLKVNPVHIGYIEPGHGLKGKQRWLNDDSDLIGMYDCHGKRREIHLWCQSSEQSKVPKRKHATDDDSDQQPPKKTACMKKIQDVEEIVGKLQSKHGAKYSVEQVNAWAHLIHLKKHASIDKPPELPYFTGRTCRSGKHAATETKNPVVSPITTVHSPSKRVNLRSECISQLDRWHSLLEKGCISQEQYDELKVTILKDIMNV